MMTTEQMREETRKWIGKRVRRGPDWKWENQDGGAGGQGTVTSNDTSSTGWVRVKWDNGNTNSYRVATGQVDLEAVGFVNKVQSLTKVPAKLSRCVLCGSSGEDLIFKFYCSQSSCKNFHL